MFQFRQLKVLILEARFYCTSCHLMLDVMKYYTVI